MNSTVLIVYGVGGHKDEAERLMEKLIAAAEQPLEFVALCEKGVRPSVSVREVFLVPEFRRKDSRPVSSFVSMMRCSVMVLIRMFQITRQYKIKLVMSTGPGLAIPCFAWSKLFGKKTLFIESWCRFYQRSFSGNVCRFLADRFYFQNKSLHPLYPKGRWSGRL